jgi:ribonuclease P protein component
MGEANVPTQHAQTSEEPRVPSSDVDTRRPGDPGRTSPQGPRPAQRLTPPIHRLRGRAAIAAASRGRRASVGPITVRYAPLAATAAPTVGFAIGRRTGTAVVRNRIRRRLRAVAREAAPNLVPGAYMVTAAASAATAPFADLRRAFGDAARGAARTGRT